ncbi:hypothetical protein MD588_07210 [Photobacterium sp. SDRW27]|uniref:hypothetical protein n=1 Tax=Photobacterium obscurum TaxID=2829490 RepID=UPI002244D75C|nr:hypothetical protein [Photobacterium obscurum]MCW8328594.1 hypothetical protein [Photobacterium obscurum]
MNRKVNRHHIARWSLGLVMLVIFVCSGQNTGIVPSCPLNTHSTVELSANDSSSKTIRDTDSADADKQCELTDHLLQLHQLSFELALISISILFLLITLFTGHPYRVPVLTEPIPPTRRRHLTLCVFRE